MRQELIERAQQALMQQGTFALGIGESNFYDVNRAKLDWESMFGELNNPDTANKVIELSHKIQQPFEIHVIGVEG